MDPKNPSYRWWVLALSAVGTLMVILDSSIVNVALPHMMSAFGVNRDQIEWVSNAFMLATAVAMPLVGWIVTRLDYKVFFIASLFMFTVGSALCAMAWSYDALIFARVLQAVGGGGIQPLGMAMMGDLFAPEERGRAMGVWGMGIVIGPAVGPTLGGYLTQWFNWRAIFAVNLPVGAVAIIAALIIMRPNELDEHKPTFDFLGFGFLTMFLIAVLLGMTNGQEKGWTSPYIVICAILSVVGLIMFLAVEASVEHPLLDLKLFRSRNYSLSMTLMVIRSVGLFGGIFLLPIFLENIVGYTTIQTGLWMAPGAITVGICMPFAGRLADRIDPKWMMAIGSAIAGYSMFMYGHLEPRTGTWGIIGPQILRGLGMAMMMAPMMAGALNSVPQKKIATASSFLNIGSRVGGGIGIALLNTIVTNRAHTNAVRLGEGMAHQGLTFAHLADRLAHVPMPAIPGLPPGGVGKAILAFSQLAMMHAQVLAFDNGFVLGGIILAVTGIPLSLVLKKQVRRKKGERAAPGRDAAAAPSEADDPGIAAEAGAA